MNKSAPVLLGLLFLVVPACRTTDSDRASVDDAVSAVLPEIRYYEIADT